MKTLLTLLLLTGLTYSQLTLDSSQVTKLIIKLNEREYLLKKDSLTSIELLKKDTLISNLESIVKNQTTIINNNDLTISELRSKLGQIEQSGLKWFHYLGGSGLILTIGILTGLLIK